MKKITLLLTVFLTIQLNAQDSLSMENMASILKVFNHQEKAWNQGDIPAFMEGYWKSENLVFNGASGPVFGWEETKQRYLKSYPDTTTMGKLTFKVINIQQINQGIVQLIGSFHLKRNIGDLKGYFTLNWKKFKDQWLIISDHTSSSN